MKSFEEYRDKYKDLPVRRKLDDLVACLETIGDKRVKAALSEARVVHDSYLAEVAELQKTVNWLFDEIDNELKKLEEK